MRTTIASLMLLLAPCGAIATATTPPALPETPTAAQQTPPLPKLPTPEALQQALMDLFRLVVQGTATAVLLKERPDYEMRQRLSVYIGHYLAIPTLAADLLTWSFILLGTLAGWHYLFRHIADGFWRWVVTLGSACGLLLLFNLTFTALCLPSTFQQQESYRLYRGEKKMVLRLDTSTKRQLIYNDGSISANTTLSQLILAPYRRMTLIGGQSKDGRLVLWLLRQRLLSNQDMYIRSSGAWPDLYKVVLYADASGGGLLCDVHESMEGDYKTVGLPQSYRCIALFVEEDMLICAFESISEPGLYYELSLPLQEWNQGLVATLLPEQAGAKPEAASSLPHGKP